MNDNNSKNNSDTSCLIDNQGHKQRKVNFKHFYFSFEGRVCRKDYWYYLFIPLIGLTFFTELLKYIFKFHWAVIDIPLLILVFCPSLAVSVKRWQDRNKSFVWIFINVIPYLGPTWAFIENGFLPGTNGPNDYGADPLAENDTNANEMA